MTPRNLTLFAMPPELDLSELEACAAAHAKAPITPGAMTAIGFVPPMGAGSSAFVHQVQGVLKLVVEIESRILPPQVIQRALDERIEKVTAESGKRPTGRARKRLREDVVAELLPRAFLRTERTAVLIAPAVGICAVDTAAAKRADLVVGELRRALGSFPVQPFAVASDVAGRMTAWLAQSEDLPAGLALGDACRLEGPDKAQVTCRNIALHAHELERHLEGGMRASRLRLQLEDRVGFELGRDLVVRGLQLPPYTDESDMDHESIESVLDAQLVLAGAELGALVQALRTAFGDPAAALQDEAVLAKAA